MSRMDLTCRFGDWAIAVDSVAVDPLFSAADRAGHAWSEDDLRDVAAYGLRPVTLDDRGVIDGYFGSLRRPLSDYTFSQLFTWRNSLRILWRELDGHLCV